MKLIDMSLARHVAAGFDTNRDGRLDDELDFGGPMGAVAVETIARGLAADTLSLRGDRLVRGGVGKPAVVRGADGRDALAEVAVDLPRLAAELSRLVADAAPVADEGQVHQLLLRARREFTRLRASDRWFGLARRDRRQADALAGRRDALVGALALADMPQVRLRLRAATHALYALARAASAATTLAEAQAVERQRRALAAELGALRTALGEVPALARGLQALVPVR